MHDPAKIYLAVWMLLGNAAILTVSEVSNLERFNEMLNDGEDACLRSRFKLILDPIHVSDHCRSVLPASATDAREANFVKNFLGESGSHLHRARTPGGAEHACL